MGWLVKGGGGAHTREKLAAAAAERSEVIEPALARGADVVSDRFTPSSLAYQGFGRGLDLDELRRLSDWATGGLDPDLVVLLEVPVDVVRRRQGRRPDRMEAEDDAFHSRVAEGYRRLAAAEPGRWVVVDGTGEIDEVAARVRDAVGAPLP